MDLQKTRELHDLLFAFMGLFHEKFVIPMRREYKGLPWVKKNHAKIMHILYHYNNLTATEIGRMLDLEKGSVTGLIDQLEQKGMVQRDDDASDRRKSLISLRASGQKEMQKAMDFYTRKLEEFFHNVDAGEIDRFIASLRYVVAFMKNM